MPISTKFLLAELTHNNAGAYWEAGFAEGLGKPVIYLCRKDLFDDKSKGTHFDTNHHLTVVWKAEKMDEAARRLKDNSRNISRRLNMNAIVRRSVLTCPECGFAAHATLPTNACQCFKACRNCKALLRPKPGDCCVFCSFGSVRCPPVQEHRGC